MSVCDHSIPGICCQYVFTIFSIIKHSDAFEISYIENIMENGAFAPACALLSIIFSKVFKTLLRFF